MTKMSTLLTGFTLLLFQNFSFAQISQTVRGSVSDATSQKGLVKATVSLADTEHKTFTDAKGDFIIKNVPPGRYTAVVTNVGFTTKKITELLVQSGKELILNVILEPSINQLSETTVTAASPNLSGALTSINTITTEQVMRYPATFMDPARLAQSFAGVAVNNDQANGISVRGNNPNTLQWRLEGVEIVNPNHTSNAGTFGDLPTAAGGGVNILSAQLLGNMNFLTGAFPAEYGNVLGGVMDMRLRKGNDTEREYTAQVGFIGIDLSAEGPFSKNSKASYLVNYRYSFTGLLGLGGIDFGGEAIAFQDLSFNISIPTKKAGDFTIFGMGGNSSNVFTSPEDPAEWEEEKSQFNIDFRSKMGAIGVTHEKRFGNILWRNVVAVSGTESERIQDLAQNGTNVQYNFTTKRLISLSSTLQQPLGKRNSIKYGMYATFQKDGLSIREIANQKFSDESTLLQPFASVTFRPFERLTANVGVHYLYYSMSNSISVEPRLSAAYKLSDKQTIAAGYGLHSQQQPPLLYITSRLDLNKAHHFILNHTFTTSKNSFFKTELFYQRLFNIPNIPINQSLIFPASSGINLIDVVPFTQYVNSGNGTNYGVEFTYQKYLTDGFFMLANATLYNSTFEIANQTFDTRFNGNYIFNLTIGKEWERTKNRILGVNGRVVYMGGFRDTPIDLQASRNFRTTTYEPNVPFTAQQADFFRPDLRIYWRKSKAKYSRMLSLDIQNFANYENEAFRYYDSFLDEIVVKKQLGLIPMINYRWEF
ncbi:MAG: hypothetical protein ACI9V1_000862 [Spirosomataceae bacterium]|jgi:hypothetical protein